GRAETSRRLARLRRPGLPAALDGVGGRPAPQTLRHAPGGGDPARGGVPPDDGQGLRRAGVPLPVRETRPRLRSRPRLERRAGDPPELLPLVIATRSGAAR